jgi:hypothetical protein
MLLSFLRRAGQKKVEGLGEICGRKKAFGFAEFETMRKSRSGMTAVAVHDHDDLWVLSNLIATLLGEHYLS